MAEEAEDAARAVAGVTNSEGAGASSGGAVDGSGDQPWFRGRLCRHQPFDFGQRRGGRSSNMQRDYAARMARHREDLISPSEIGQQAGERAVARLNPGRMKSGPMPVVLDPRVGGSLVGHLLGAMSGASIARRASFLIGRLEEQLFDSAVRIVDDPLRAWVPLATVRWRRFADRRT
jgi:PmbA protein